MSNDPDKTSRKFGGKAFLSLLVVFAALLLLEIPLLISHARHGYFKIDGWFAFYAVLGLVSCFLVVFVARGIGKLIRREDSHYGDVTDESQPEDLDERIR